MPSTDGSERRRHIRKPYSNVIKFLVNPGTTDKTMTGVSINISESGMCLYTSDSLHEGEVISIQEKLPVKYQKATVIWVKNYHRGFYRIGLMFRD